MDNLKERLEYLEAENIRLRERETDNAAVLRLLIKKLPMAAVAIDSELRVIYANNSFIELLDWDNRVIVDEMPHLKGVFFKSIVSKQLFTLVQGVHISGDDAVRADLHLPDGDYNISVYNIRRSELSIAIVNNMNNPEVRTTEVVARLKETIDRNISMIQQIALLLGEEVSENAKEIGAVIQTLQYPNK